MLLFFRKVSEKMKNRKLLYILLAIVLVVGFLYIRSSSESGLAFTDSLISSVSEEQDTPSSVPVQDDSPAMEEITEEAEAPEDAAEETAEESEDVSEPALLDEDGIYDSKEDVALYLHIYHHLPSNFITKDEAKKMGWSGSGGDKLDKYCPGMCIGGDYFGNYEGVLPKGKYKECDIDTLGQKSRGVKRIVFSSDWYIYYTDDHYETFELLYEP